MLQITVQPPDELWDETKEMFVTVKPRTLQLEHSLVSLSKWESKWCKPFLVKTPEKTNVEVLDYIKCMTLTQNVDPNIYSFLSDDNIKQINDYIDAPMTATTFYDDPMSRTSNREIITAELIYYWMFALNIPMECQKWHLNRLLTLIEVCSRKSQPPKKRSKNEIMRRNSALNDSRKKKLHTKG